MENRMEDTRKVKCNCCEWQGEARELNHGYAPLPNEDDVEPADYCPKCNSADIYCPPMEVSNA